MNETRLEDMQRFYTLLDTLENKVGGKRLLTHCHGRMDWPARGVYFFFETGETRNHLDIGPRVVRVGTHAVSAGSNSTLWKRLSSHRGNQSGSGGNHRGSIFRLLLGEALTKMEPAFACMTWGQGASAPKSIRDLETSLEKEVTAYFSRLPFLWLEADDVPSAKSVRGYVERNAIALLSNYRVSAEIDPASPDWLGRLSERPKVRESGLWNQNYVDSEYDRRFLDVLASLIQTQNI